MAAAFYPGRRVGSNHKLVQTISGNCLMNNSITPCRSCGGTNLKLVLSLGHTPLANSLLTASQLEETEPIFPLELAFCPDCTLVQILESVPPDKLFREYLYFS